MCNISADILCKKFAFFPNAYHALITLSSKDVLPAWALSCLPVANLWHRAVSVALAGCKEGEERGLFIMADYYLNPSNNKHLFNQVTLLRIKIDAQNTLKILKIILLEWYFSGNFLFQN